MWMIIKQVLNQTVREENLHCVLYVVLYLNKRVKQTLFGINVDGIQRVKNHHHNVNCGASSRGQYTDH